MPDAHKEFFSQLPAEAKLVLEQLPCALERVLPLKAVHRRDLPFAVQELSARLTCERTGGERPYWSSPRLASAYLRYFLPWNLLRLTRLIATLTLPQPPCDAAQRVTLVDIGSGPLTLPLALWLAKASWRELPLDVVCLDTSPRALDLGRALFAQVAGERTRWRIVPLRASLAKLGRELRGRPWLISAANVLNEQKSERSPLGRRLDSFVEQAAGLLHPQGLLLCVVPGTRLGGKLVQGLRDKALTLRFVPQEPCPHTRACPLQGSRTWCHFSLSTRHAPDWLNDLAQEAGLPKKDLHLSFVLLHRQALKGQGALGSAGERTVPARIISAPFRVPGIQTPVRYACSARGLLLLTQAADAPSGTLVELSWPARPGKDSHSGAWIL